MLCRIVLFLACVQNLPAGDWMVATVVYSHCAPVTDAFSAPQRGFMQPTHEEIDLDAGDFTYSAEQWVARRAALGLAVGSKIQFSVKGKTLSIRLDGNKRRKLKLLATYPRHSSPGK